MSTNTAFVIGMIDAGFCSTYISAEPVLKDKQLLQQMADVHM